MTLLPILLPEGLSLKVSVGDKVAAGQILAEGAGKGHEEIIHVAHDLKLVPQKAIASLKKNLGDSVSAGEVLAFKKSLLGSKEIISEFSGIIIKLDEVSGDLVIRVSGGTQSLKAINSPVDGLVDFCDNQKVVLKTDKEVILALDGVGGEAEGEIEYLADSDETKLNTGIKGRIILTKAIDNLYLFKTIGLEAVGIITENLKDIDFIDLVEKHVRMPVLEVSEEDFKRLVKDKDKKIYLFGKNKSIVLL
ncbi:MAG: hypothetical protein ABSD69_00900 [Candidatus Levyibacteriota bacterium]|jgi:hypothetical protein